ncbi:type I restriction enzyme HsdR N-terminal domain-containing protein [Niabella terrae]
MILIEYPAPDFKTEIRNGQRYIFDQLRRKWLLLQDEEWVRQNFVGYLLQVMRYPATLIALEKEIYLGSLKKRFDILVYNSEHQPWMLIECKRTAVPLTDQTLQQILRYHIAMPANYLILTNGQQTHGWKKTDQGFQAITALPEFPAHH